MKSEKTLPFRMKKVQGFFDYLFYPFFCPRLFFPFLTVFLLKLIWALFLFYSVQWPLKVILSPLIVRFYGPLVLHYPSHIWWMYTILRKTAWWFDIIGGAFASCVLIKYLWYDFSHQMIKIRKFPFLVYLAISVFLFYLGQILFPQEVIKILPKTRVIFWSTIVVFNAFLQAMFTPGLIFMILKEKVSGFFDAFRILSRLFWRYFIVVLLAFLLFLPGILWEGDFLRLVWVKAYPELSIVFLFCQDILAILINTMVYSLFVGWIYELSKTERQI